MKNLAPGRPSPTSFRFGLRRQATLATVALAVAVAAATALAYSFQWNLSRAASRTVGIDLRQAALAHHIAFEAAKCFGWQAEFEAVHHDPAARQETLESWHDASRSLQRLLEQATAAAPSDGRAEATVLQNSGKQYQEEFLPVVDRVRAGHIASREDLRNALAPARSTILAITTGAEELSLRWVAACEADGRWLQQLISSLARLMTLRSIVAFLVLAVASLWLSRNILSRTDVLSAAMDRFTGGNYAVRVACDANDELGVLGQQFNKMASMLQATRETPTCDDAVEPSNQASEINSCELSQPLSDEVKLDGRILLAEDGPENQRLISRILQRAGARVDVVNNGLDVLEGVLSREGPPIAEQSPPFELILMDVDMPRMGGCETARRLRQAGYTGRMIAVTGHAQRGDSSECLRAGFDDCVAKPIDRRRLLKAVGKHSDDGSHLLQATKGG